MNRTDQLISEDLYGPEPALLGPKFVADRQGLFHAFTWYFHCREVKDMREYVRSYISRNYSAEVLTCYNRSKDHETSMTMAVIARLITAGCDVHPHEREFLDVRIQALNVKYENFVDIERVVSHKESFLIASTDEMLDDFYLHDYKSKLPDYYSYLIRYMPTQAEAKAMLDHYAPLLSEIETRDDLNSSQKKNYKAFLQKIVDDTQAWLRFKQNAKVLKPRRKRRKSAAKIVAKVKYKVACDDLKITSISPETIIGASTVWLYNTRYKRLTLLEGSNMSVKGTTIKGFDPDLSLTKVIRKPEKNLKPLLELDKRKLTNEFRKLKTKAQEANGRLSSDVLILKAYK